MSRPGVPTLFQLHVYFQGKCMWCGEQTLLDEEPGHPRAATREHLVPKSKGGRSEARNLALACWECNQARGSRPMREGVRLQDIQARGPEHKRAAGVLRAYIASLAGEEPSPAVQRYRLLQLARCRTW